MGVWQDDVASLGVSPTAGASETNGIVRKLEERVAYLECLVGANLVSIGSDQIGLVSDSEIPRGSHV